MAPSVDAAREQFERIAVPLMDAVHTTARYLVRDHAEAEDLVQETYLRAYRFWGRFTPGTNCKAWLLTILHNLFRNRYRDQQREQRVIEYDADLVDHDRSPHLADDASGNPEERLLSQLLDAEIEEALQKLPSDFLTAIVLVDVEELTYDEAAEVMACPVGTVRSRLSRGRRLLHAELRGYARARGLLASG